MSLDDIKKLRTQFLDVIDGAISNLENGVEVGASTKNSTEVTFKNKISINNNFERDYDKWDKNNPRTVFTIGKTSDALKSIGIKNADIIIDASKLIKIRNDHPEMTDEIIKQIPNIIENPIIVMESKSVNSRVTMFGEVISGKTPILVVLELSPKKKNKIALDKIKVASAYGKNNAQNFINSSNILYVDSNKKRVKAWEKRTGLQLPVGSSIPNSNSIISNPNENVNIKKSLDVDSEGNTLSKQQQEYFKDSKVRDENGNLLVVYHGTSEEFTVFDREKGRHNMDIQGSFFSPWELDASGYGNNVRAFYLNITNPASESLGYKALRRFQGQNNTGVKAREYLESLGYDGVNNGNEEYIAFNSNQIKAVDNLNPTDSEDIRYSKDVDFEEYDENFDRNVIDSFGITKINDYRHVQIQVFNTLVNEGFFDEKASRIVTNANSGMKVEINESGIEEAFDPKNYGNRGKRLKILKLASIRHVPDIIENGTLTFDNEKNYHNDNSNVKYAYIESQTILNGKPVTIRITVRKSLQKNKFWVHNIYTNEKNTTDLSAGESFSKTDYLTDSDDDMLTQDLSNVKFSKDVEDYDINSLIKQNKKLQKSVEYYKMMMGYNRRTLKCVS